MKGTYPQNESDQKMLTKLQSSKKHLKNKNSQSLPLKINENQFQNKTKPIKTKHNRSPALKNSIDSTIDRKVQSLSLSSDSGQYESRLGISTMRSVVSWDKDYAPSASQRW